MDPYYSRPEVSNSRLTWVKQYFQPPLWYVDLSNAYRHGTLVDCLITEPHKVDFYKRRIEHYSYTQPEIDTGKRMRDKFWSHSLCRSIAEKSTMQKIIIRPAFKIEYGNFTFELSTRCKFDLFVDPYDMAGDIKTTCSRTQKQFQQTILDLDYDRQGAWYLDHPEKKRENFVIIGISKHEPFDIFIVTMKRGDKLYNSGKEKYQELAFRHWSLL